MEAARAYREAKRGKERQRDRKHMHTGRETKRHMRVTAAMHREVTTADESIRSTRIDRRVWGNANTSARTALTAHPTPSHTQQCTHCFWGCVLYGIQ